MGWCEHLDAHCISHLMERLVIADDFFKLSDKDPILFDHNDLSDAVVYQKHKTGKPQNRWILFSILTLICVIISLALTSASLIALSPIKTGLCNDAKICVLVRISENRESDHGHLVRRDQIELFTKKGHHNVYEIILYDEWNENVFKSTNSNYLNQIKNLIQIAKKNGINVHYYLGSGDYNYFMNHNFTNAPSETLSIKQVTGILHDLSKIGIQKFILGFIFDRIEDGNFALKDGSNSKITKIVNAIREGIETEEGTGKRWKTHHVLELYVDLSRFMDFEVSDVVNDISANTSRISGFLLDVTRIVDNDKIVFELEKIPSSMIYFHSGTVMGKRSLGNAFTTIIHQFISYLPGKSIIFEDDLVDTQREIEDVASTAKWSQETIISSNKFHFFTLSLIKDWLMLYLPNLQRNAAIVIVGKMEGDDKSLDLQSELTKRRLTLKWPKTIRTQNGSSFNVDAYSLPVRNGEIWVLEGRMNIHK